jgi:periplasmic nitrate reductase NapE
MPPTAPDPVDEGRAVPPAPPASDRRRWELGMFFAVVAVIIPLLTVALIGAYALFVWIFQMFVFGPPGPLGD